MPYGSKALRSQPASSRQTHRQALLLKQTKRASDGERRLSLSSSALPALGRRRKPAPYACRPRGGRRQPPPATALASIYSCQNPFFAYLSKMYILLQVLNVFGSDIFFLPPMGAAAPRFPVNVEPGLTRVLVPRFAHAPSVPPLTISYMQVSLSLDPLNNTNTVVVAIIETLGSYTCWGPS